MTLENVKGDEKYTAGSDDKIIMGIQTEKTFIIREQPTKNFRYP